jgi:hypothetical protein
MVASPAARFRGRVRRRGRRLLQDALHLPELAEWLAAHAPEMAILDDPALWGFADAVQAAANRVARGEIAAEEAVVDLLARSGARRFLQT